MLRQENHIPFEMWNKTIHNPENWISSDKIIAEKHYDVLFGAFVPNIDYKVGEPME